MRFCLVEYSPEGKYTSCRGACIVDEIGCEQDNQIIHNISQVYVLHEDDYTLPLSSNKILHLKGRQEEPDWAEHEEKPHAIKAAAELGNQVYKRINAFAEELTEKKAIAMERWENAAPQVNYSQEKEEAHLRSNTSSAKNYSFIDSVNEIIHDVCYRVDSNRPSSIDKQFQDLIEYFRDSSSRNDRNVKMFIKKVEDEKAAENKANIARERLRKQKEEIKREEERRKNILEEELSRKRAEEELNRKRAEEELNRKRAEEELNRKRAEEELNRKRVEEELAKKRAEEELAKKCEEVGKYGSVPPKQYPPSQEKELQCSKNTVADDLDDIYTVFSPEVIPYICSSRVEYFRAQLNIYNNIKNLYESKKDSNVLFDARMLFKTRIGQSTLSQSKIIEISKSIHERLNVIISQDKEIYNCALYILAEAIVGENEISVRKKNAIPIASLCSVLAEKHENLLSLLIGSLYTKCPFILPRYKVKYKIFTNDYIQSQDEYFKKMKYKTKFGVNETDIQYCERMCGVFAIYAAIIQTSNVRSVHGIENAWQWIAMTLNQKPTSITPHMLYTFFEVCGSHFLATYKRQALKIISFIRNVYIDMFPEDCASTAHRIRSFFSDTLDKTGMIPELAVIKPN